MAGGGGVGVGRVTIVWARPCCPTCVGRMSGRPRLGRPPRDWPVADPSLASHRRTDSSPMTDKSSTPLSVAVLRWSLPVRVAELRHSRSQLPSSPGVYVFSKSPMSWEHGILYVGMTTRSLRSRVPSYLADPERVRLLSRRRPGETSSSLRHAGKVQLLMEFMSSGGAGEYVRWACCANPRTVEVQLIRDLKPAYNTQHAYPRESASSDDGSSE